MENIIIKPNILKALAELAAKKDIRFYLNGVLIDIRTDELRYVATDGSLMGLYKWEYPEGVKAEKEVQIIVPHDTIKAMKADYYTLSSDLTMFVAPDKSTVAVNAIKGIYPNYERVFPATSNITGEEYRYNILLIEKFAKTLKLLAKEHGQKSPIGFVKGGLKTTAGAVIFESIPEFTGVIMPLSYKGREDATPVYKNPVV